MEQGVVHSYHLGDDTVIEVSFRGGSQLLPGGSVGFLKREEMEEAIQVVLKKLDWEALLPIIAPKMWAIWKDVSTSRGWDFHPSHFSTTLEFGDRKQLKVYRQAINSEL